MLEIEQKFADADFAAIEAKLAEWGAAAPELHDEADHYLNAPDRDFRTTGEAFRLRRVGRANYLTFKGPRHAGPVKVRTELEIPLVDGDEGAEQMLQLFKHLGYRLVAVVRKRRRIFHVKRRDYNMDVCLDEVEGVGRYAEVEVLSEEDGADAARAALVETARELGLTGVEQRSYLELYLSRQGREGE